jgi:hypothetical protein
LKPRFNLETLILLKHGLQEIHIIHPSSVSAILSVILHELILVIVNEWLRLKHIAQHFIVLNQHVPHLLRGIEEETEDFRLQVGVLKDLSNNVFAFQLSES